tara:strand:+ start:625 stop:888 length:264 start_codon:yes stop_codon:yes gene_type:complete
MKKSFSSMDASEFEVVMKSEYAARAKRNRVAALRARIEQTEHYVSNMQNQLHKDRMELALEMSPELLELAVEMSSDNELCGARGEEA